MEHHGNLLPWQRVAEQTRATLRAVELKENFELDYNQLTNSIDANTKMVAICHISNTIGTVNDIKKIIEKAHNFDSPVLIDAAQSAAFYPIDKKSIDYDFLAFSGHKIFGPFGTGVLYANSKYHTEMEPYTVGGGIVKEVQEQTTNYKNFPYNLDAGTPNIAGVIGLGAALKFVNEIDRKEARDYIQYLGLYAFEQLEIIEGVSIYGNKNNNTGIISFSIHNIHPHDAASFLNMDGIAVRAGMHCTQPLLKYLKIPATIRLSFSIYNSKAEIDKAIESIKRVIKGLVMTKEELEILYREKILPENKNPYHFEEREDFSIKILAYNPICGDKFSIYFNDKDKFEEQFFSGIGCAISKSSTSLMVKTLEGKNYHEALEICKNF